MKAGHPIASEHLNIQHHQKLAEDELNNNIFTYLFGPYLLHELHVWDAYALPTRANLEKYVIDLVEARHQLTESQRDFITKEIKDESNVKLLMHHLYQLPSRYDAHMAIDLNENKIWGYGRNVTECQFVAFSKLQNNGILVLDPIVHRIKLIPCTVAAYCSYQENGDEENSNLLTTGEIIIHKRDIQAVARTINVMKSGTYTNPPLSAIFT